MSPISLTAFVLTRQWRDGLHGLELILWLKTDQKPTRAVICDQKALFFIRQQDSDRATRFLKHIKGYESRPLTLKNFEKNLITACYFSNQRDLYSARDQLRKHQIEVFESDVQPTERFLMERFIRGSLKMRAEITPRTGFDEALHSKMHGAELQQTPCFTMASIDIETDMRASEIYSMAMVYGVHNQSPSQQTVFMIDQSNVTQTDLLHTGVHYVKNEHELIHAFINWCHHYDPDLMIGWNLINFDFRVLQQRADALSIPFCIGRDGSPLDWRQSRDDSEHYTLIMPGRVVLCGIDTLKSATYQFESFSLEHVSRQVLDRGKLIQQHDQRGEEIGRLYHKDKPALAAYNLEDCQLVWDIFIKTELVDFATRRACMTGLAMDRFGGSVAAFDHNYLPVLHRKGYIAPNVPQHPRGIGSPGGYVMSSRPGIYNNVLVLDFKSLYPSIIRTFKIDPLGLAMGYQLQPIPANDEQQESESDNKTELVPGFNGAVFSKQHAILPAIIEQLWQLRDEAKVKQDHALSQTIKILMNSFYGVLGTPGCRFFDYRLPSSITLRGHQILTQSKAFIEEQGHEVIYGDTDSVFVLIKESMSANKVHKTGNELASALNHWWKNRLQQQHQLESHLEIEFETHFTHFLMPTIRGSEQGSKKRYAGIIEQQGDEKLIFKGLETVRTDWTLLAREFQRNLYWKIFHGEDYRIYIQQLVSDTLAGKNDQLLIYRKRLRRPLADYVKNIPPHAQAAKILEDSRALDNLPPRYQPGSWVEYVLTRSGPEPVEGQSSPLDYQLYIERQLQPVADGILHFLGDSFDQITSDQMNLF